jgi:hypothetical protein
MAVFRFEYPLSVCDRPIASLKGCARIERTEVDRWRIKSIMVDSLDGTPVVLPHTFDLHAVLAAWLCSERRDEIDQAIARHDRAANLMRAML